MYSVIVSVHTADINRTVNNNRAQISVAVNGCGVAGGLGGGTALPPPTRKNDRKKKKTIAEFICTTDTPLRYASPRVIFNL